LGPLHNKAIGLDPKDRHAPFPGLFIIHEMRVRGFHPFFNSDLSDEELEVHWQDWIQSRGVLSDDKAPNGQYFKRNSDGPMSLSNQSSLSTVMGSGGGRMALNNDVIAEILAATRAMPSWKACELENTSWVGTADDNIKRYMALQESWGSV
jgi:hypothetical protein